MNRTNTSRMEFTAATSPESWVLPDPEIILYGRIYYWLPGDQGLWQPIDVFRLYSETDLLVAVRLMIDPFGDQPSIDIAMGNSLMSMSTQFDYLQYNDWASLEWELNLSGAGEFNLYANGSPVTTISAFKSTATSIGMPSPVSTDRVVLGPNTGVITTEHPFGIDSVEVNDTGIPSANPPNAFVWPPEEPPEEPPGPSPQENVRALGRLPLNEYSLGKHMENSAPSNLGRRYPGSPF